MQIIRASVLIPTKNGGTLFGEVLDEVLAQETPWPFEVVVVDSGSIDQTVGVARVRGIRCEEIAPESFGHGKTRNLLASLSSGEFLVFITQDAKPAHKDWLRQLVDGCACEANVAASFGPHIAYPQARLVTRRELAAHFAGFGQDPSIVHMDDPQRYAVDQGYRQWLHFFSSNNACIRRSAWQKIPLPEVAFAEDQTWALKAIEAGYSKAYAPGAAVYHSHDFSVWETLQRNFDEARCFEKYFGYRLQPTLKGALWNAIKLSVRDYLWLKDAGRGVVPRLLEGAYMVAIEFARMMGQYSGTHHQSLPMTLAGFISRDETLQRKKDSK